MTEPLPDTWNGRELPVLRAIVKAIDETPGALIFIGPLEEGTGFDHADVIRAVAALESDNLLTAAWSHDAEGSSIEWVKSITGEARRLSGAWPTPETAADRLIAALEQIAENTDDEDERTRVRKILDGFAGSGRQIAVGVGTAIITGQIS